LLRGAKSIFLNPGEDVNYKIILIKAFADTLSEPLSLLFNPVWTNIKAIQTFSLQKESSGQTKSYKLCIIKKSEYLDFTSGSLYQRKQLNELS